tara:strand:+ start:3287 stop:4942 length:1656 start_codon:yes stop_codon:yes gene_type:complete
MKKFRVGFIIDNLEPDKYIIDLINFINQNESFESPILITGYSQKNSEPLIKKFINNFSLNKVLKSIFLKIIFVIEKRIVSKKYQNKETSAEKITIDKFKIKKVVGKEYTSDSFLEFTNDDLSLIANENLDCIIHCSSLNIKGEILNLTEFGIINAFHEDSFGFSEVLNGNPSSIFVIKKLGKELGNEDILFSGSLMTSNIWLANNSQLIEKSNVFLMQILDDLANNRRVNKSEGIRNTSSKSCNINSASTLLRYILKIIAPKILNSFISKLLSPNVIRYSVAFAHHDEHKKSLSSYKEISNPKGRFLADPFVFEENDTNYIFVEDMFFKDNKGRISVIKIDGENYEFLGVVLEEDFHLSFPFIFRDGSDIYMIPESHENSDIRLYKCIEFPHEWCFEKTLMSGVSAADTMMIHKENKWFMLTNICSLGLNDHQSELHIFYSDNLKSSSWNPIKSGNPVIFNSMKGRNGGLFYHKDKIYRINQVHGQAHYGKSFDINEIITLSKNEYKEVECLKIHPDFKDEIISTHSFNANSKFAVVDFARHQRLRKALKM